MKLIKRPPLKKKFVYVIIVVVSIVLVGWGLQWRPNYNQRPPILPQTTYRAGQIPAMGKRLTYLAGTRAAQSQAFNAPLSWEVYWDFLCNESSDPGYFSVLVFDKDGAQSPQVQPITAKGISGFGDQKYTMSYGELVTLQVDSNCSWQLTAKSANG